MKSLKSILLAVVLFMGVHAIANDGDIVKESFSVKGNCMMCKTTIENAVNELDGISSVKWNAVKQKVIVKFDPDITSLDKIQQKIASAGYDTDNFKATDEEYDNLHHCCKYSR